MILRKTAFALLGCLLLLAHCACGKKAVLYQVDYNGRKELFKKAKDAYEAGETVTITISKANDGEYQEQEVEVTLGAKSDYMG